MMPAQLQILDGLTRQNAALHVLLDRWDNEYAESRGKTLPAHERQLLASRAGRAREIRNELRLAEEAHRGAE